MGYLRTLLTKKAKFFSAFKVAKEPLPDVAETLAWDPALLVIHAIRELGPRGTALQIRNYIGSLNGFAGINGVYDFPKVPQRGLSDVDVVISRWRPTVNNRVIVSKPKGIPLDGMK